MKTVVITGARGYLGRWLTKKLINLNKYNIFLLLEDITSVDLRMSPPDIIIHLAAKHPSNRGNFHEVNYEATRRLASLCTDRTHFIFLSTDYVFKEHDEKEYNETSVKEPETEYGITKSLAEDFLIKNLEKVSIVRTSMLYGYYNEKRNSFIQFLIRELANKKQIDLFTDVYSHPTHVDDLSNFIFDIMENENCGVFHACKEDYINRYELAKLFCETNNLRTDLLVPTTRKLCLPKNINLKPSTKFLEIAKISLQDGLKYDFKNIGVDYAS
tara:strand:+ start:791 stop:1603 length:813 start_codon:yes stop_codon:yes gene_type:complete